MLALRNPLTNPSLLSKRLIAGGKDLKLASKRNANDMVLRKQ
jgi:hypothetical protein